jgi:hypothetical protein
VRNLGDQAVGVKAAQEPSHLGRLFERIRSESDRGTRELVAQVPIGEAVKRMLAAEQRFEEHAVMARERVERADRSAIGARGSRGQGVEGSNGGRWVIDVSQRVEVARVCLRADLAVAGKEGDALSHGHPRHDVPSLAAHAPADAELVGLVDDGLDAQHRALLVVHLDPVALHAVLDAPAGQAPRELREVELVGDEISLEVPVELPSEERHHVARLEVERAVLQEPWHQLLEIASGAEQDVGRVLRLRGYPVVAHRCQ